MLYMLFFLLLNSCTYSVNMVHSEGTATDVIDENQEAKPDVNISVPASL